MRHAADFVEVADLENGRSWAALPSPNGSYTAGNHARSEAGNWVLDATCTHEDNKVIEESREHWHSENAPWSWSRLATASELKIIAEVSAEFQQHWAECVERPVPSFTGEIDDLAALDHLLYEQYGYPSSGIDGAAIIVGEVMRRFADLLWMICKRGYWYIADTWPPPVVICPHTRLCEAYWSGSSETDPHRECFEKMCFDSFECLTDATKEKIRALSVDSESWLRPDGMLWK